MEINNNSKDVNNDNSSEESEENALEREQEELDRIVGEMVKCKSRIEKLETMEVDFDNERKSSFLELQRYKKKLIELYYKGCEIKGYTKDAGRPLLMKKTLEITGNDSIDKMINDSVNRDWFNIPGYHDILDCVQFCNEDEDLGMSDGVESSFAELAYTKVVNTIQKMRQQDLYNSFAHIYQKTEDPAKFSRPLWDQLISNDTIARSNLNSIFDEYVLKEHTLLVSKSLKKKRAPSKIQKRRNISIKPRKSSPKTSSDSSTTEFSSSDEESPPKTLKKPSIPHKTQKNALETSKMSSEEISSDSKSSGNSSDDENSSGESPAAPLPPILEEESDEDEVEVVDVYSNHQNSTEMGNSAPNFAVSTLNEQNLQLFMGNSSSQGVSNVSLRVNKVRGNFKSFSTFGETLNDSSEDDDEEKEEIEEFEVMDSSSESVKSRRFRDKCSLM